MTSEREWSPQYVLYAAASECAPEERFQLDKVIWPGGVMTGFILWIAKRQKAFFEEHPEAFFNRCDQLVDYDAWYHWLAEEIK